VETRLSQPKAIANFEASNDGELEDLDAATQELIERLATLEFDYDEGNIDGNRFKTASDKVKDKLSKLDITRARIVGGFALESVLDKGNPADAFRNASLAVRRAVIDRMLSVIVLPGVKGAKTFRPDSVKIAWKK
jgi:hypothetical protein